MTPSDIDTKLALALLSLPRQVGNHPESNDIIMAGVGRFGPYLKVGERYVKLGEDDDVLTIGLNRAVTVIAETPVRSNKNNTKAKKIGDHPEDGKSIELREGRYGPYVKHGRINASLPKDVEPDSLTIETAVELLAARAEKVGAKGSAKSKTRVKSTKKTTKKASSK